MPAAARRKLFRVNTDSTYRRPATEVHSARAPRRGFACAGLVVAAVCGCGPAHQPPHPSTSTSPSPPTTTHATTAATAPAPPPAHIAPLPVRPVIKSQPTIGGKCPATNPAAPVAPTAALTTCDLDKTTVYTLGPETLQLGLIHVDPPKSLTSDFYEVTLILDAASATAWAAFTAEHLKDHVAFIRDNLVVEAPIIEEPVSSGRIALTTQTARDADRLAQLAGRTA